jgi:adenylate cyclase
MPRNSPNQPGHLLVVDDNKVNRLLLGRGLEQEGHKVTFAENGRQALDAMHSRSFDLVLLDIEMPELNGYQVLEQMTTDMELRNTPVIMTSALDEVDSVVKCIEMGAEDYLTKPLNPILLRARVNSSLEKKRLRDQQRELISKFATSAVAQSLETDGFSLGGKFVDATAMFSDIRSFTTIVESHSPAEIIELLNDYFTLMFEAIGGNGGVVNQMIGDGLMAIFGAPQPQPNHREQAVKAALEMVEMVELFNLDQASRGKVQIRIGVGIASGDVIAGYTGTLNRATYTCVGDTVNLAARLEAHTKVVGQPILIDEATRTSLGESIRVTDQGLVQVKGKTEEVHIYSVNIR